MLAAFVFLIYIPARLIYERYQYNKPVEWKSEWFKEIITREDWDKNGNK